MAKKRISSVDLSWLILEELSDPRSRGARTSLAVVPDDKHGWRVVVSNRDKRYLTADDDRQLADVQRQLRLVYELRL
jgi:hypothetical protein